MPDVTFNAIEEMDGIYGGVARRARAELGVTAWGMQVFTLPANWDGYPAHKHDSEAFEDEAGAFQAYGIMVFALEGADVASISGFAGHPELFPELGLPLALT